jgi:hypothetical protein
MKKLVFTAIVAAAVAAASPSSAEQDASRSFDLKVTEQDVVILSEGLMAIPYGRVAGLINKLQAQIADQQKAPPPAKQPAK